MNAEKQPDRPKNLLLRLFIDTLITSTVAFGGGFVVLQMIRERFVNKYHWLTDEEMTDLLAIAQSAPGTIAGNALMLVGYTAAGFWGAVVTMIGTIIPPLAIIAVVSVFYNSLRDNIVISYLLKGMQAAVGAVILSLCVDMIRDATKKGKDIAAIVIMSAAMICSFFFGVNAIYIILAGAVSGMILLYVRRKMAERAAK